MIDEREHLCNDRISTDVLFCYMNENVKGVEEEGEKDVRNNLSY